MLSQEIDYVKMQERILGLLKLIESLQKTLNDQLEVMMRLEHRITVVEKSMLRSGKDAPPFDTGSQGG